MCISWIIKCLKLLTICYNSYVIAVLNILARLFIIHQVRGTDCFCLEFNNKVITKSPTSIEAELSLQNLQESFIKHYNQQVLFRVSAIIALKYVPVSDTLSSFVSCRARTILVLFILTSGHPIY